MKIHREKKQQMYLSNQPKNITKWSKKAFNLLGIFCRLNFLYQILTISPPFPNLLSFFPVGGREMKVSLYDEYCLQKTKNSSPSPY